MEDAKRLRARADQAERLCGGMTNNSERAKLRRIADEWALEARAAEEAELREAAKARPAP